MSDPVEILERRLQAILDRSANTLGLHFFCQLGGYDDDLGIITFQVSGTGKVLLSWRQSPDDVDLWAMRFDDDDFHQFVRLLMTHRFWTARAPRRGRDGDETNIHLRISSLDIGTHQGIQFWTGDMEDLPVLRKLMLPLSKLMQNISYDTITDEDLEPLFS